MAEIRSIGALRAIKENNNSLISPLECLEDAAMDIKVSSVSCNKLLIIRLDNKDGRYDTGFWCANMKTSELIALLAIMQQKFIEYIKEMS